jgi:hypothetical protein
MDISTLQSLLETSAQQLAQARMSDLFENGSNVDYNYALGVEHGINSVVRMLRDTLEAELEARDKDAQWTDYVVRSAIENNTFDGHYISWDRAYDEAAEELDVDHDTLCDAFQRVQEAA